MASNLTPEQMVSLGSEIGSEGDHEAAIRWFQRALTVDSRYAPAHLEMGRALYQQKQYQLAISSLNRAIQESPYDFTNARTVRAVCYLALSDFQNALKDVDYFIGKAQELAKAGSGGILKKWPKVFDWPALFSPPSPDDYIIRARAYGGLKNYQRAFADFRQAILLMGQNAVALRSMSSLEYHRGNLYLESNAYQEAFNDLDHVLKRSAQESLPDDIDLDTLRRNRDEAARRIGRIS